MKTLINGIIFDSIVKKTNLEIYKFGLHTIFVRPEKVQLTCLYPLSKISGTHMEKYTVYFDTLQDACNQIILDVVPLKYQDMATGAYWKGIKTTSIKYNRSNSITIQRMSHYITLDKIIIKPYKQGFVGKGIYKKNYQPDMYYTEYYDQEGNEVNRKDLLTA